jgi:hypothetical protein
MGWGGDFIAFYAGWRFTSPATAGQSYCTGHLAVPGVAGPLDVPGLVADVDAYLAAMAVRSGVDLATHLRGADRPTRFSQFFAGRFNADLATAATLAERMLTVVGDDSLVAARGLLLMGMTPSPVVVGDEVRALCQGFAARLSALAGAEGPTRHPAHRKSYRKAP